MQDLINQHAPALLEIIFWMFTVLGGAFVSVMVWMGLKVSDKLDGIQFQISKTNETLGSIERDIRGELTAHDHRLVVVEQKLEQVIGQ